MEENKEKNLAGEDFDSLLRDSLPPEVERRVSRLVTPWKKGLHYIFVMLVLTMFPISGIWVFDLIFPAVAYAFGLMGWYLLRDANSGFRRGWILQLIRTICFLLLTGMQLNIHTSCLLTERSKIISVSLFMLLEFLQLMALQQGILLAQRQAGQKEKCGAVTGLIIWRITMLLLATLHANGAETLIMILLYFVCIGFLGRLIHSLDEAGYILKPKASKFNPWALPGTYGAVLIIGGALLFGLGSRYPMRWQPRTDTLSAEAEAVAKDLLSKGFPEEVLKDLTQEDILSCKGSLYVMKNKNYVGSRFGVDPVTGVAVVLSEGGKNAKEREQNPRIWRVFYHFAILDQEDYWGTECVEIRPYAFSRQADAGCITDEPKGWILREDQAETLRMPIPSVKLEYRQGTKDLTVHGEDFDGELWSGESWFASFSLPRSFKNARVYVSMTVENPIPEIDSVEKETVESLYDELYDTSAIFYVHQNKAWQYPVYSAAAYRIRGGGLGYLPWETFTVAPIRGSFGLPDWYDAEPAP